MLVNGIPKGFFKGSRGLCQGDPLFPYLFIIVANLLERMAAKANSVGLIEGFELSSEGPTVPFIQFADDSLFCLKAEVEGMKNLKCILLIMEAVTGLKVSWAKSSFSLVGVCPDVNEIASILGRDIVPHLIIYLGLPLGAKSFLRRFGVRWLRR